MPSRGTPRKSFRMPPDIMVMVKAIAEHQGGLTDTQVVVNGVKAYYREVFDVGKAASEKKSRKSLRVS